ncbi:MULTISPECIES: TonB-dependent receptor [unclassified Sphingobacterium]|uniref:TonB-dependent receptor n=1 Tax=unclassified Sphingobacterium TaxID=2609468 RepID=UPI0025F37E07|nr:MULTISPECIES: TonB-dependent receptor [unclassified Sphingobacterium]
MEKDTILNLCFFVLTLFCGIYTADAQTKTTALPVRNVSGLLRDSLDKPIEGATVSLVSGKDSLMTATNKFGFYGFKEVKSAEFLLSIRATGHKPYNRKYFNSDIKPQLNIPPIRLGIKEEQLKEVTISGLRGPLLKGDTTEFWAKDYIVRDYARLEDLLRRMEGITIDPDGSVYYNGQQVVKALFNNQTYFKGSVREIMKELPADIVERIQIIDRDESGLMGKGMKSEQSVKVLNVVTKADKSAGKMYDISLEGGTQDRYKGQAGLRTIDGKDQRSYKLGYSQRPLGIKSDAVPGSISGMTTNVTIRESRQTESYGCAANTFAGISQNLAIGKFNLTPTYDFKLDNIKKGTERRSETYYEQGNIAVDNLQSQKQRNQHHELVTMFDMNKGNAGLNMSGALNLSYTVFDRNSVERGLRSGLVKGLELLEKDEKGNALKYNLNVRNEYQATKKLILRTGLYSSLNTERKDETSKNDIYNNPSDLTQADSSVYQTRPQNNSNWSTNLTNSLIWKKSDLIKYQFNLGVQHKYALRNIRSYLIDGQGIEVYNPGLSNYQSETNVGIPIAIEPEVSFKNGVFLSPSLGGSFQSLAGKITQNGQSIKRSDFLFTPRFTVGFRNNKTGSLNIGLSRSVSQPAVTMLNPTVYYLTAYDVQVGNPKLENTIRNAADIRYEIFLRKMRLSISLLGMYAKNEKIITSNRTARIIADKNILITESSYVNMAGGNQIQSHLTISKFLNKLNSTLKLTGNVMQSDNPYMANGKVEGRRSLSQTYHVSVLYNPVKWIDIAPEIKYEGLRDKNTLIATNGSTYSNSFFANMKLGVYLPKDWAVNVDLSQAVYNTTNLMTNKSPFVINANIEKRLFPKKNGILSFVIMDATRENAVTNYVSSNLGYNNMVTNTNSRYFLLQFSYRPELFGKSRYDKGKGRKGDGSFIE